MIQFLVQKCIHVRWALLSTINCHEGLIFPKPERLTEQHPTDKEFSLNQNRRNANASLRRLQTSSLLGFQETR